MFVLLLPFLTGACNNARRLPEGSYLLTDNQVSIHNEHMDSDIRVRRHIRQKPNRTTLGFLRWHLTLYTLGEGMQRETRVKNWLMESVGEPPVILDTAMADNSTRQMEYFLENKGFFDANVEYSVDYKSNNKATVTYHIYGNKPYRINKVKYIAEDTALLPEIKATRENTLLEPGRVFDADQFDKERNRIARHMRNNGYYYFNKNFINFRVDSTIGGRNIDVQFQVNKRVFRSQLDNDSLIPLPHRKYTVERVFVYPDYDPLKDEGAAYDTLIVSTPKGDYHFLFLDEIPYKPHVLTRFIFVRPGEYYSLDKVQMTSSRLASLRQFRFVNVGFAERNTHMRPWHRDTLPHVLDCHIRLTRDDPQHYTVEWLGKNTSRDLGTEFSLTYGNNNLFRGAELFNLSTNLSAEMQQIMGDMDSRLIGDVLPFNTVELGGNATLELPRFFIPVDQDRFPHYFKPRTTLFAGYNYRERPDYRRHLFNVSFGYRWDESETKRHQLTPLDISAIKLYPDAAFQRRLQDIDNQRLIAAYQDHLIVGMKYTFLLNTQAQRKSYPDFWFFRANVELAGNTMQLISPLLGAEKNQDGNYEVFNIRYAQYVRTDLDFRYHYRLNEYSTFATRIALGAGFPYGNLNVLPFEKGFFVGGANGIRAWPVRSLGPGGYTGTGTFMDRTGDLSLEASLEYRFPVYRFFHGALFLDAGNIWLNKENENFPDGHFEPGRFFEQLAVGTGTGVRLDFSFFVVRVDMGVQMVDPARPEDQRWVLDSFNTNFNFGIGYPF